MAMAESKNTRNKCGRWQRHRQCNISLNVPRAVGPIVSLINRLLSSSFLKSHNSQQKYTKNCSVSIHLYAAHFLFNGIIPTKLAFYSSFVSIFNLNSLLLCRKLQFSLSHVFHSFEDSYQFMKSFFSGRQHVRLHSALSSLSALKPPDSDRPVLTSKPPQLRTLNRSFSDSLPIIDTQQRLPVPTVSSATIAFAMDMVLSHLPQTLPHGRDA